MTPPEPECPVATTALSIARALKHASAGDLAAMRRMQDDRGAPLFWRMSARHPEIARRPEDWAVIARILALLTPTGEAGKRPDLHDRGRRLGTVLCDGGARDWSGDRPKLSEQRLARLLAGRGAQRRVALERAARMLANRRPPGPLVNVPDIAWAILNPATRQIAQQYYSRLDHAAQTIGKEADNA